MNFGLIPMSAKPYHIGHHNMIKRASEENDAVIVFASTSDRKRGIAPGLTGHVMVRIWETHIIPLMPRNVEIRLGGNPVRKIYELLGVANESGEKDTFRIYSSAEDLEKNFPQTSMLKYTRALMDNKQIEMRATKRYTSGTEVRQLLESNDLEGFMACMPEGLSTKELTKIFKLLGQNLI